MYASQTAYYAFEKNQANYAQNYAVLGYCKI